jgi:L-rhamnose isomerase/sugar isomerase
MKNDRASEILREKLARRNIDVEAVKSALKKQTVETPSWGYGDSGTRFMVFKQPGAARTIFEKIEDAACVQKFTGITPTLAVHVLWDLVGVEVGKVRDYAESLGVKIGSINPTLFEQNDYNYGSVAHPDKKVQAKAVQHMLESVEIMRQCRSKYMSVWLADGTNYPGQDDLRGRRHRVAANLKKVHEALDDGMEMLLEYKFFEPAFYSTDVGDWGTAYVFAKKCGPRAKVLVDLGHHPLGTNIEQIVSILVDEQMLGGFHFNSRKYADDDLTVGSMNPYELFLIFNELVSAKEGLGLYEAAYMIDQSHNIKPKIEAMIQSVMNIQEIYAKSLCVDRTRLKQAQQACDVIAAEKVLKEAFFTDVTALLESVREEMGLEADPLETYRQSGYQHQIEKERA